jgi:N-acetylmuramoyl-L-alanine amidase
MDRRRFLMGSLVAGSGLLLADPVLAQAAKPRTAAKPVAKPPKRIVAIDAGHGGRDPGAIGLRGTYEKDVTFQVALDLAKRLEASGRYDAVLTRRDDTLIPLADRVKLARAKSSTLFVSLHADSVPHKPEAHGFSVYTLSDKASDDMAAGLATRENAVDRLAGVDLSKHGRQVRSILLDLMHRETSNNSLAMAHTLVGTLNPPFTPLQNPHRQADFAVLRAPDVPSILVEMGFLSNQQDEKLLNQRSYQLKMADRLVAAVDTFFANQKA